MAVFCFFTVPKLLDLSDTSPVHQPVLDGGNETGVANEVRHCLGLVLLNPQLPARIRCLCF